MTIVNPKLLGIEEDGTRWSYYEPKRLANGATSLRLRREKGSTQDTFDFYWDKGAEFLDVSVVWAYRNSYGNCSGATPEMSYELYQDLLEQAGNTPGVVELLGC